MNVDIFGRPSGRSGGGTKGARGLRGPRGLKGTDGPKGEKGIQGPGGKDGEKGLPGSKGEKGSQGQTGKDGEKGPQGQKGKDGESGMKEFCAWMPNMVIKHLQEEDEYCCFFLTDPKKDIKRNDKNKIVEWFNRNKKQQNIVAEIPAAEDLIKIFSYGYALDFQKSRYWAPEMDLFVCTPGYGYFCITFRVDSSGTEPQALVTNYKPNDPFHQFHEIIVSTNEIRIYGWKNKQLAFTTIHHNCTAWTTLFLEYHTTTRKQGLQGSFIINNDQSTQKSFTFDHPLMCRSGIYIGARKNNTQFMDGAIHAIESYFRELGHEKLPQPLKDLIIKNQMIHNN